MEEVEQIHEFMSKVGPNVQVIWGASFDEELKDKVKITLIATGFEVSDIPGMPLTIAKSHPHKPSAVNSEVSSFFDFTKKEAEKETEETEVESEVVKPDINKSFEQYYVNSLHPETEPEPEPEPIVEPVIKFEEPEPEPEPELEYPVINLDDLEDESTLKKVVNIPAWKRRLMK